MTEEEAKTKFCPHQRAYNANGANVWSLDGDKRLLHTMCLGSACMAWRTHYAGIVVQDRKTGKEREVRAGESYSDNSEIVVREIPGSTGFCGLSGAPRQ